METKVNYDLNSPTANMYGFEPCPKCNGKYRCSFNNNPRQVECDDCGYKEDIRTTLESTSPAISELSNLAPSRYPKIPQ